MAQYLVNVVGPSCTFTQTATGVPSNIVSEIGEGYDSPFTPGPIATTPPAANYGYTN